MKRIKELNLTEADRLQLEKGYHNGPTHSYRIRCKSILLKSSGKSASQIAEMLDVVESDFICEFGVIKFFLNLAFNFGVKVVTVFILNFKEPAHMVDTGNKLSSALKLILHS